MPAKNQTKDTVAPAGMLDLLAWWEEVEAEHNVMLEVRMRRVLPAQAKRVSVEVASYKLSCDASAAPTHTARLSWPTASHKNVLSLMWYLIRQVELQLEASAALDGLSTP
jgi:hypothetical protein